MTSLITAKKTKNKKKKKPFSAKPVSKDRSDIIVGTMFAEIWTLTTSRFVQLA